MNYRFCQQLANACSDRADLRLAAKDSTEFIVMVRETGRVYIVDDDAEICRSISLVCGSVGYTTKAYSTAEEYLAEESDEEPHCLIVDLLLPGMTGMKLCREIRASNPSCGFIVITGNGDVPSAVEAMRLGAVDYLEKPFGRQRLLDSIHEVLQLVQMQHVQRQRHLEAVSRLARLTVREKEVFRKVAAGQPTKAIAASCGISTRTVDVHRSRILQKLGIESSMQLADFIAALDRTPGGRAGWLST